MAGHSLPAHAPGRQLAQRIVTYPAHVTLSALMSLAVVVLERRISKALRSNRDPTARPAREGPEREIRTST